MSQAMRIKVEVNRSACCAYGLCAEICPEVFHLDDNGIASATDELVPPELEETAREAVSACPQLAIKLIESNG